MSLLFLSRFVSVSGYLVVGLKGIAFIARTIPPDWRHVDHPVAKLDERATDDGTWQNPRKKGQRGMRWLGSGDVDSATSVHDCGWSCEADPV